MNFIQIFLEDIKLKFKFIYRMYRALVVIVMLAIASICSAQLNFSPGWGKRTMPNPSPMGDNCKTSVDAIMLIYKLIQVS